MLESVFHHRFLAASHIRLLHFRGAGLRVVQVRLRRLWEAQFLDRLFLPPEMPDQRDRWMGVPLYSLAALGAELVAEGQALDVGQIPHTRAQNRQGFSTLRHHLAFTDFAVAAQAYIGYAAAPTREHTMRSKLDTFRRSRAIPHALLPDGAVTLSHSSLSIPQTYLIEIVRAGVRAGNDTIRRRLHRYRAALRSGFFRDVYGFAWVRDVVFLTPTWRRAETLALLARDVPGGERLFRFGVYESKAGEPPATVHFPGETTPPPRDPHRL